MVNLNDFLLKDPLGLNMVLDPEGKRIPGSVANKVILARALVNNPKLLILEDPLEQIPSGEKEKIISKITKPDSPWRIIVATVDPLWTKYIKSEVRLHKKVYN